MWRVGLTPELGKKNWAHANWGLLHLFIMEIQSRLPVSRPSPVRQEARVQEQRTADQLASRRDLEQNAIDQRRQKELDLLRRAQAAQADKGRRVDRYA